MTGVLLQEKCCPEACCLPDGTCVDLTRADCIAQGGTPQGCGTKCADPDIECGELQACCFDNGDCGDFTPADCVAAGGRPQGKGTSCGETLPCAFCGEGGEADCIDPWTERGCPFTVLASFSEVVMNNNSQGTQCTSPQGGSIAYIGPHCIESLDFVCGYSNGSSEVIGVSECGGSLRTNPFGNQTDTLGCGGFGDCKRYTFGASLRCTCPGQAVIDVQFIWFNHSNTGCPPLGDWGEGTVNQGGAEGSSCRLRLS